MKKEDPPVVVEQIVYCSTVSAWHALTDPVQMRKWFFDNIPDFKPKPGFETAFNIESGERNFFHLWKVIEAVPGKMITINWKYKDYLGDSNVKFEIAQEADSVKIIVSLTVLEDFPDDVPEFKRESCIAGWNYFINKNLKEYLEVKCGL